MVHQTLVAAVLTAGILLPTAAAFGEDKIYPAGTDCANQPTIAERLLCGQQEFRRESGVSNQQPAPLPEQPALSPNVADDPRMTTPLASQPRTASPND